MPQSVLLISEGQVFCLLQLPLLSLFIALIVSAATATATAISIADTLVLRASIDL